MEAKDQTEVHDQLIRCNSKEFGSGPFVFYCDGMQVVLQHMGQPFTPIGHNMSRSLDGLLKT
jgi:hypothetical protein